MRTNRLLTVTVLSALAVTGLAACGSEGAGSKGSAAAPAASGQATAAASATATGAAAGGGLAALGSAEIVKKAQEAGAALTAVKMTFKIKDTDGEVSGDIAADGSGNCAGSVAIAGQGSTEVLRSGGTVWVKPDAALLKTAAPQAGGALLGKWLTVAKGSSGGVAEFTAFCDLGLKTQQSIGKDDNGVSDPGTKGPAKKVDGVDAVTVVFKDTDGTQAEAAVAAQGKPYLISLDLGADGFMKFTDFDKPVQATPPAASQVVDGSKYFG